MRSGGGARPTQAAVFLLVIIVVVVAVASSSCSLLLFRGAHAFAVVTRSHKGLEAARLRLSRLGMVGIV